MNTNLRDVLIFWFETPPKVSKGAFNYVTKVWGNKVIYVCNRDFPEYRKKTNWDDGDFGDADVIYLSEYENPDEKVKEIIKMYPHAINVVTAFSKNIFKRIQKYLFVKGKKNIAFSERPVNYGGILVSILRLLNNNIKYRYHYFKFDKYISIFLPLGQKGVADFNRFGWNNSKLFPFMYNPLIPKYEIKELKRVSNNIRFLYVGRFFYETKGIDILMKASSLLKGNNWKLDLVGGYGKDANKVIKWAEKQVKVNYIGSWPSEEVGKNMGNYDVVIIPSRYDGWNLLANEAITARIGTIITDEAVSDEMIKASGAGKVVAAGNVPALANAMQEVINNPEIVVDWKQKALKYEPCISSEIVGNYFINILDYTFYDSTLPRPHCPWL